MVTGAYRGFDGAGVQRNGEAASSGAAALAPSVHGVIIKSTSVCEAMPTVYIEQKHPKSMAN